MAFATKRPEPLDEARAAPYQADFYSWTQQQGALLRADRLDALDRENLAEEIESLGRNEFDKLVSFYRLVLLHMLKCDHQPERHSRSWAISIVSHRDNAAEVLADNPGLKPRTEEALSRAYRRARLEAADETGLTIPTFPEACPYSLGEVFNRPFPVD